MLPCPNILQNHTKYISHLLGFGQTVILKIAMAKVGYRWIWMAFGFLVLVLIFAESGLPAEDDRFWLVKLRAIHTNRNSGNSSFLNGESNIDADDEAMLMAAAHRVAHRLGYRVARRVSRNRKQVFVM